LFVYIEHFPDDKLRLSGGHGNGQQVTVCRQVERCPTDIFLTREGNVMKTSIGIIQRFWADEEGAVAIEYGLLAVLIALAVAAGATILGDGLSTLFTNIGACFSADGGGACPVTMPAPL
jgi:pilus assembly protein Flp/PilA